MIIGVNSPTYDSCLLKKAYRGDGSEMEADKLLMGYDKCLGDGSRGSWMEADKRRPSDGS
jgi:hypothetical protein